MLSREHDGKRSKGERKGLGGKTKMWTSSYHLRSVAIQFTMLLALVKGFDEPGAEN